MSGQQIITPKVTKWAEQILTAWTAGVEGILYTALLVSEARLDCSDEEWRQVLEELPFGERHAQRLVHISRDSRLPTHVSLYVVRPARAGQRTFRGICVRFADGHDTHGQALARDGRDASPVPQRH